MTYEEAIKILKDSEHYAFLVGKWDEGNALNMAIEALQQQNADGCKGCKYASKDEYEMPCLMCKNNKMNHWRGE